MFVLLKRKGVEERGRELGRGTTVEDGACKGENRTAWSGMDMWTKAFDHHTHSNYQATD